MKWIMMAIALAAVLTTPPAAGQTATWTRQFEILEATGVSELAIDATGVYAAGTTVDPLVTDPSIEGWDVYVRRYDLQGSELWTRLIGMPGDDYFGGMAADSTGVYVAVMETVDIGDYIDSIRRYDVMGNELWTRTLPGQPMDVAATADATYVVGHTLTQAGLRDYLRKYDQSGTELWTRLFWAGRQGYAPGVAADAAGVYVATQGFGTAAFDPEGNRSWLRRWKKEPGSLIGVGSDGIYVAGNRDFDVVIRQYDLKGTPVWTRRFGTPRYDWAYGLETDENGVYVVGVTRGEFPGQTSVGGRLDGFVVAYGLSGIPSWIMQFGTTRSDYARAALLGEGVIFVAGSTYGEFVGAEGDGSAFVAAMQSPA
jgi:hypothetical protein